MCLQCYFSCCWSAMTSQTPSCANINGELCSVLHRCWVDEGSLRCMFSRTLHSERDNCVVPECAAIATMDRLLCRQALPNKHGRESLPSTEILQHAASFHRPHFQVQASPAYGQLAVPQRAGTWKFSFLVDRASHEAGRSLSSAFTLKFFPRSPCKPASGFPGPRSPRRAVFVLECSRGTSFTRDAVPACCPKRKSSLCLSCNPLSP